MSTGWTSEFDYLQQAEMERCPSCAWRAEQARRRQGGGPLQILAPFSHLTDAQRREVYAIHEAGHAVVGYQIGMRPGLIELGTAPEGVEGTDIPRHGRVAWDRVPENEHLTVRQLATASVAGMRATRRWMVERGICTPANDLDGVMAAIGDIRLMERKFRGRGIDTGAEVVAASPDADRLIAENWNTLNAVSQELLRHGRLDRSHFEDVLHREQQVRRDAHQLVYHGTTGLGGAEARGIEAIWTAVSATREATERMSAALHQVYTLAADLLSNIGPAIDGSGQPEVQQALQALLSLATEQIPAAREACTVVAQRIETYSTRL